jgi:hypothetical protein
MAVRASLHSLSAIQQRENPLPSRGAHAVFPAWSGSIAEPNVLLLPTAGQGRAVILRRLRGTLLKLVMHHHTHPVGAPEGGLSSGRPSKVKRLSIPCTGA